MNKSIFLILITLCSSLALFAPALAASHSSQKPSAREVRELMASVCSSGVKTGTCAPCPAFIEGGAGDGFSLETVVYGKFTNAKKTDALLDFSGCEAHVHNFGGSVLLRWQGLTKWKFVTYVPGYLTDQCLKFPARDGRDLLLCQADYFGMGTAISSLLLEDFLAKQTDTQQLFSTYDTTNACQTTGSIQTLLEWTQVRLNADRYPDLQAKVKSAAYTRKEAKADDPCAPEILSGASRTYTLEYTFDGGKFTPTQATRGVLKQLLRDNPYLMGGG